MECGSGWSAYDRWRLAAVCQTSGIGGKADSYKHVSQRQRGREGIRRPCFFDHSILANE
jgi:hypothetical protein